MSTSETDHQITRLRRLVHISLGISGVLAFVNAALAYVLFAFVLAEPAQVAGVTEPHASQATEEGDYRVEMRAFFDRMTDLLDREARKAGVNPADIVPTQKQIDDAVETRTVHSDESQVVLQRLREGFDYFDMTWPIATPER